LENLRTVEIAPPSVHAETVNVLKTAAAIVVLAAAYVFRPSIGAPDAARETPIGLLPYQRLIRDAPAGEQRMYRELREGLLEAERIRAETGHWPDVSTLAAEAIPPFAPDPTRAFEYKWTSVRQDWVTNYLGVPSDSSQPAWLLVILEPEPGAPPDPAPNDETHHRLPDGTTLHVSIWSMAEDTRRSGFAALRLPQNDGWTNWLVGTDAQ
jgi:hypothetical protein